MYVYISLFAYIAMRFLVRIAGLIHFEDTPSNLYQHCFPNFDVISHILVALTSSKSLHFSSGIAHSRDIYALLKQVLGSSNNEVRNALFSLLIKLEVLVPIGCCRYVLPFRLQKERNGLNLSLSQYLTPYPSGDDNSSPTYVRRLYELNPLPSFFWNRLISALVQKSQIPLGAEGQYQKTITSAFWAKGMVSHYENGCFIVTAVEEESQSDDCFARIECSKRCITSATGLDIVVFDRYRRFAALGLICSVVESLLQEWVASKGISMSFDLLFNN